MKINEARVYLFLEHFHVVLHVLHYLKGLPRFTLYELIDIMGPPHEHTQSYPNP